MQTIFKIIFLVLFFQFTFLRSVNANLSYCQDYIENGIFSPTFHPDLWTIDASGKFKKNIAYLENSEFKAQGSFEELPGKIIVSKKFIPTVPVTKTEIELTTDGKVLKVNSYSVMATDPNTAMLFSSYEFKYSHGICYPNEEWDDNSGTIFNTNFCNEAKPLIQNFYQHKKSRRKLSTEDEEDKISPNEKLSTALIELFRKHNIRYKDTKPYLDIVEARAKKQSVEPSSLIIEKALMIYKACKDMSGVSRAYLDSKLAP